MSGRRLGAVLALGVVLAMLIELTLQFAMHAVRIQATSVHWETAMAGKAVWLVAITIGATVAPWLSAAARVPMARREACHAAGTTLIVTPLVWTVATLTVLAADIPWTSSSFYAQLIVNTAPWVLAGVVLRTVRRHIVE
jgi:hypothetical protein